MTAIIKIEEPLETFFEQTPVPGSPGVYIIRGKELPRVTDREVTAEEWDKFEHDIEDAFEQV